MDLCPHCHFSLPPDATDTCTECGKPLFDRTIPRREPKREPEPLSPDEAKTLMRATEEPAEPEPPAADDAEAADRTIARPVTPRGPTGKAKSPTDIAPPADPIIGKVLGGCRIDKLLGRGAMGAVYEATQVNLERTVAVKTIRPEYVSDESVLKRFQQEAKTVGRFSTPHVVQIHQVGYQEGIHFLVMEYVDGGDLRELVQSRSVRRLETQEALRYMREGCLGLKEAQEAGVLHRDIKPDNLLLTSKGVLKIADFGIAKMLSSDVHMTRTSELTGTPLYMSPEQCRAEELDFRSDMYSLGACFFYLITGQPPAKGSSVYELLQTKTRVKFLSPERALPNVKISGPLSRIIEKMTAQNKEDRYGSYDELLADLDRVEAGAEPIAKVPVHRAAKTVDRTQRVQREEEAAKKSALPRVAALIVVLAAGAWAAWTFYLEGVMGGANGIALAAELRTCKQRFVDQGPTAGLLADVRALVSKTPEELPVRREIEEFEKDVNDAGRIQDDLAKLAEPESLSLPFRGSGGLATYLGELTAATKPRPGGGDELRSWARGQRDSRRQSETLVKLARTALEGYWAGIQKSWINRPKAAAAQLGFVEREIKPKIATLRGDRDYLKSVFASLEAAPSEAAIAQLETQFPTAPKTVVGVRTEVEFAADLAGFKAQFATDGPSGSLRQDVGALYAEVPKGMAVRDEIQRFNSDLSDAVRIQQGLDTHQEPAHLSLPFDGLDTYLKKIEGVTKTRQGAGEELLEWAAAHHRKLRESETLKTLAKKAVSDYWKSIQSTRPREMEDAAQLRDVQKRIGILRDNAKHLAKLYPKLEVNLPEAGIAALETQIAGRRDGLRIKKTLVDLRKPAAEIKSLADWKKNRDDLVTKKKEADEWANEHPDQVGLVSRERAALDAGFTKWTAVEKAMQDAARAFGERRLAQVAALAQKHADVPEFGSVAAAASAVRSGFRFATGQLKLAEARKAFEHAMGVLRPLDDTFDAARRYVTSCTTALGKLESAAKGMVPVLGGEVQPTVLPSPIPVSSFFIAPKEVTRAEYKAFLVEVEKVRDFEKVKAMAGGFCWQTRGQMDQGLALLPSLQRESNLLQYPVDYINYFDATAFAHWDGKPTDLPTLAEWWLAAHGDRRSHTRFPWGDAWGKSGRNWRAAPTEVGDGGLSARFKKLDLDVHHLSGNVAEWLQPPTAGARKSFVVGGNYEDNRLTAGQQQKYYSGEDPREERMEVRKKGYGLRLVLRPRRFFADLDPVE